jgi:hypothetical protein
MLVTRTCRPIKIGFVVNPADAGAIRTAIETSTFLWGGQYNPLIPLYSRKPRYWDSFFERFDRQAVLRGYLDAFDPDFVTTLGDIKLDQSAIGCRKLVRAEHILGDVKCYGAPHVGIGLFEILDHLIATELQFVRSRPIQFRLPLASDSASLFFAAIFGSLEASLATTFRARYFARIGVEEKPCDESNFTDFLGTRNVYIPLFPRRPE